MTKISVLGSGAVGSMLGGLLKLGDPRLQVVLVARGEHGRVMQQNHGVRLKGPWGSWHAPVEVTNRVEGIAGSELVLLTVKSHDTESALQSALCSLGRAVVVSIQNGIHDSVLLRHLPPERVVIGLTVANMAVLQPGVCSLHREGVTLLGPHADRQNDQACARAVELLGHTGLTVKSYDDILAARYAKLAINAIGYASCLSASNFITGALGDPAWRTEVGLRIAEECLAVLRRAGIAPVRIPGTPALPRLVRWLRALNVPLVGAAVEAGARFLYNQRPITFSLYQDLMRGKRTEVDYINGQFVRLADLHGLSAPYNRQVVKMVHELEECGTGRFFSREEVVRSFRQICAPQQPTIVTSA
jgi:2-dehydropantoate 2-reductase